MVVVVVRWWWFGGGGSVVVVRWWWFGGGGSVVNATALGAVSENRQVSDILLVYIFYFVQVIHCN